MKYHKRRHRKLQDDKDYLFPAIEGYLTIRELEKFLPLDRKTLYRYSGKYGHERYKGFPKREIIGNAWRWKIYDIYLWLGKIKPKEKLHKMQMIKLEKLVDIEQASTMLEYHDEYIRKLCREKELPCYKSKKKWLFIPSELDQWQRLSERI